MNLLSIMLYFAEVLNNVQGIFIALAILSGLAIFIGCVNALFADDHNIEKFKSAIRYIWITVCLALFAAFIPSQNTVYMIAASEIAEEGYKSEIGQKLTNIVNEKLEEYLTELSETPVSDTIKKIDLSKASSAEVEYLEKKLGELKK